MSNLLEISGKDIAELNDSDLRELIGLLCEEDYRRGNLSTKGITWGGEQDAADGGLDVVVRDEIEPPNDSFVPRRHTVFQVKKPKMPKSKILKEMKPKGVLRDCIKELIKKKGAYIIASSKDNLTDVSLKSRIDAMHEAVEGEDNHKNLVLDFYDRNRIASWVRSHSFMIRWVRKKIDRPLTGQTTIAPMGDSNIAGQDIINIQKTQKIVQGIDERDLKLWLDKFDTSKKDTRIKEIQDWYENKKIESNLKDALVMVVEMIDEELKASQETIEKLKAEGNFELAKLFEQLNTAFEKGLDELENEESRILTEIDKASAKQKLEVYLSLAHKFDSAYQFHKAIDRYERALTIQKQYFESEKNKIAALLGKLGTRHQYVSNYPKAIEYHTQALNIAKEIEDRQSEGNQLGNLGIAYDSLGKIEKAIEYHTQALDIAKEIEDRQIERNQLGSLGAVYQNLGQLDKAIEYHTQALNIAKEIEDRQSEGNQLGNLGIAYQKLGQVNKAIKLHTQALNIAREIEDRQIERNQLCNLGSAYNSLGQVEKAIGYFTLSLDMDKEIEDRQGEGTTLGNLGIAYGSLGKIEKAIEYFTQALDIAREVKARRDEGRHLGNLGIAYDSLGKIEKAIEYHTQTLDIERETKNRQGEGTTLGNLGIAYGSLGKIEKAIEYFTQALDIAREVKARRDEGRHLGNLGIAYDSLGKIEKAIEYHTQTLDIAKEIKDRNIEGNQLHKLGIAYQKLGQFDKAKEYMNKAMMIFEKIKSPNSVIVRKTLTEIEAAQKN